MNELKKKTHFSLKARSLCLSFIKNVNISFVKENYNLLGNCLDRNCLEAKNIEWNRLANYSIQRKFAILRRKRISESMSVFRKIDIFFNVFFQE